MKKPPTPKTLLFIDALRAAYPQALTVEEIMAKSGVRRNMLPLVTSLGAAQFVGIRPGGGGSGLFRFCPEYDITNPTTTAPT